MKDKIQFSVLMSVYHKEKASNLIEAIDSIVNQTLLPDEFLIVEDGPLTEELDNVLKEYTQKYKWIRTLKLEKNLGLGNALREGVINCKYEYIARMDSDDISVNDRFEKQIVYMQNNINCDLVGGNIQEFDDLTGKELSYRIVPNSKEVILNYLKKRNPFNHVTVLFKKKSVIESGNYLDCPYFEDYYLWGRMIKNNKKLDNINENLVKVRAGLKMSERRGKLKYIKYIINFEKKLLELGLINRLNYLYNVSIRIIVSMIPNFIRYQLYQRRLRSEKN